ncbi:MAG: glycosyltransferase family 39 protein [Sphingomonadaceae bacterium]|nr:glycosyltransferase family 39 protein [Sphingomonadaceae bacterium]
MSASWRARAPYLIPWALALLLLAMLAGRFAIFLVDSWAAATYSYELDYGEGIVWQQADMIFEGRGYGDITRYPFIVFHYPPLYHLVSGGLARLTGLDPLLTGRLVSLLATLATAALIFWMVSGAAERRRDALPSAAIAALLPFLTTPFLLWSPLMRVDMLALLFGTAGIALIVASRERPRLAILAGLCFALAVFTRQTAIFAPAACFAALLLVDRRRALFAIAVTVGWGLIFLAAAIIATDGGFLDHVFLYNINRFSAEHFARYMGRALRPQLPLLLLAALVTIGLIVYLARLRRESGSRAFFAAIAEDRGRFTLLVALIYLAISAAGLAMVAKIGSNLNYFLDFYVAITLVVGIALHLLLTRARVGHDGAEARAVSYASLIAVIGLVQVAVAMRPIYRQFIDHRPPAAELAATVEEMGRAERPIVSDDMVLLRRAGKQVPWESAIFAELAYMGLWDEAPIIRMIDDRAFAMLYTYGGPGNPFFEARYTPGVQAAIARAYPRKRRIGGFVMHYPVAP